MSVQWLMNKIDDRRVLSPFAVIAFFIGINILGIFFLFRLPLNFTPSEENNKLNISFSWPLTAAEAVERNVTVKIEALAASIKGIKDVSSSSYNDGGSVDIELSSDADYGAVKYQIAILIKELARKLPAGVSYPLVTSQGAGRAENTMLSYDVWANCSYRELNDKLSKILIPRIKREFDVRYSVAGVPKLCYKIFPDPSLLRENKLSVKDIREAIADHHIDLSLGYIPRYDEKGISKISSFIQFKAESADSADLMNTVIKNRVGKSILLMDVAKIRLSDVPSSQKLRINRCNGLVLNISPEGKGPHLNDVARIKSLVSTLVKQRMPGVNVVLINDPTSGLKQEIDENIRLGFLDLLIVLCFVLIIHRSLGHIFLIIISWVTTILFSAVLFFSFAIPIHLFTLVALSISLGIVIDNSIVVIDHFRQKRNNKVILAVLGSTIATVGSTCIIFFLDLDEKNSLNDFGRVLICNMLTSLTVSFFLLPALMSLYPRLLCKQQLSVSRLKRVHNLNRLYFKFIAFIFRHSIKFATLVTLLFGTPLYMLPVKLEGAGELVRLYNATFGSNFYTETLRPWADVLTGGFFRPFTVNKPEDKPRGTNESSMISVDITLPPGSKISELENVIFSYEKLISRLRQINLIRVLANGNGHATITLTVLPSHRNEAFLAHLRNILETKAMSLGTAEVKIQGLDKGPILGGAANEMNYEIVLKGYRLNVLNKIADSLKSILLRTGRVKQIAIGNQQFFQNLVKTNERLFSLISADDEIYQYPGRGSFADAMSGLSGRSEGIGYLNRNGEALPVIVEELGKTQDQWHLMNMPIVSDSNSYLKLNRLFAVKDQSTALAIERKNQQYQLVVSYSFIGEGILGFNITQKIVNSINSTLPVGFSASISEMHFKEKSEGGTTWAVLAAIGIVFLVCTTLLNDFMVPFIVLLMVPCSFIGVFILDVICEAPINSGTYISMILLCGIVVSGALYILNDYSSLIKAMPKRKSHVLYIKSVNSKIIPVFISRISVFLGMAPLLWASGLAGFWYTLALNVCAGAVFSLVVLLIGLPFVLKIKSQNLKN